MTKPKLTKMEAYEKRLNRERKLVFATSFCFAVLIFIHTPVMSFPVEIEEGVEAQVYLGPLEISCMGLGRAFPMIEPYTKYVLVPGIFVKEAARVIATCFFNAEVEGATCDASRLFDSSYLLKEADYSWLNDAYAEAVGAYRSVIEVGSFLVVKGAFLFFWRTALFSSFMAQVLLGFGVMKAGVTIAPSMFYVGFILACTLIQPSIEPPEEDSEEKETVPKTSATKVAQKASPAASNQTKKNK
mmetsp:Transcript_17917/g.32703  ORF Transcript_17917/g.32703 Transcript_17917/m.32703 type:complete len:243 (-) Transcript_17917:578-1306(-)|eukprot:CAMPEP_0175057628 /NCGR_PEP_ID=MMETSP0052_2-20121109/11367_1 /TAXON_ID=51329 ORGANISM="Polytomella parva, Strain SAG 63-3" /NCGR_SAMPLE_ID=MMETSP0052_2 /ASSEMBLY_ACC=CAM_ASM_000194 /LENGTH=242 /DNA_ID=CAMNT_0016322857 /DNA_START=53 /DNA_END=781 /DNA_ORIENTATION=+